MINKSDFIHFQKIRNYASNALQWEYCIKVCNNQTSFGRNPRICSAHFNESDTKRNKYVLLSASAVPSVFPNSNYVDYDVLLKNKENAEPYQPRSKNVKLEVEHLKSNASCRAFFPPLLLSEDFMMTSAISMNEVSENLVQDFTITSDTLMNEANENCIVSVQETINDSSIDTNVPFNVLNGKIVTTRPKRKVRYPGDIDENIQMSPNTIRSNFRLCKNKIKIQAKKISQLKQTVKRQRKQIQTLKELLRKLKSSYGLSAQAVQSIEHTFEDEIIEQLTNGRRSRSKH